MRKPLSESKFFDTSKSQWKRSTHNVRNRNFTEGLDWGSEQSQEDTTSSICLWCNAERCGSENYDVGRQGKQICRAFSVLQGQRLPDDASPAVEQELG